MGGKVSPCSASLLGYRRGVFRPCWWAEHALRRAISLPGVPGRPLRPIISHPNPGTGWRIDAFQAFVQRFWQLSGEGKNDMDLTSGELFHPKTVSPETLTRGLAFHCFAHDITDKAIIPVLSLFRETIAIMDTDTDVQSPACQVLGDFYFQRDGIGSVEWSLSSLGV